MTISSKAVSSEAAPCPQADPGSQAPRVCWGIQAGMGARGAAAPKPPGLASDRHLVLAGGAQVLGQVMAGDELQLLQRALALEGWPTGQRAPSPAGVRHPGRLRGAVQAVVVVRMQARRRGQPVERRGGPPGS